MRVIFSKQKKHIRKVCANLTIKQTFLFRLCIYFMQTLKNSGMPMLCALPKNNSSMSINVISLLMHLVQRF